MIKFSLLVFVLTSTPKELLALKITTKPRPQNRVEIRYWHEANLECESYVQCDRFTPFILDGEVEFIVMLEQSDYDRVVLKFNEFYPILNMQKEYEESLKRT
ncbi:hypothetical protein [Lysinibacillus sp. G4S2]|uniref:hypothetical protein n=1 Tax=Lysinibacillus sp. G4S2 TaxID=3055859 RepID=UPI0025A1DAA9|nr:hypothetical protein [Lysinibacillus sp. G4S2]MDM5247704.1 hypothetical protein [Lysinibacillus sp. G4S2]